MIWKASGDVIRWLASYLSIVSYMLMVCGEYLRCFRRYSSNILAPINNPLGIGPPLPGPSLKNFPTLTVIPQLALHSSIPRHLSWDTICGSFIIFHSFARRFQVSSINNNFFHCIPINPLWHGLDTTSHGCYRFWFHYFTHHKSDTGHNLFRSVHYHRGRVRDELLLLTMDTGAGACPQADNNNNRNTITRRCWWGLCGSTTVCRCRSLDVLGEFN